MVKTNAPELLAQWLATHRTRHEIIAFSGVTDCYQPLEASYELTRRCLETCAEFRQPVGLITKGALIERDVELLARVHARAGARCYVSLAFHDDDDARRLEPFAASPSRRLRTIQRLADAGVPVGVAVAPVIPGLNDHQIPAILEAARDAGATRAFLTLLRLPAEVLPVFEERLRAAYPGTRRQGPLAARRDARWQAAGRALRQAHVRQRTALGTRRSSVRDAREAPGT